MGGNGQLGFSFLWLARLGYVMVNLACLRLGMAPLWSAMVGLALLLLTWLVFDLAWHRYGRQWSAWLLFSLIRSAWLCYDWLCLTLLGFAMIGNGWLGFIWLAMVGWAWLGFAIVAMALFYGLLKRE
jgi:hypothetical protein